MHEFQVTINLIKYLVKVASERGAKKVSEVYVEIGELTHLSQEQIQFLYSMLSARYPELNSSKLYISKRRAKIMCLDCNYTGGLGGEDDLLAFICPNCGSANIRVLEGTGFTVTRIKLIL